MTATMRLTLRAGEKIYVNGAVLKVDRKTSIELLNDAAFLLEAHVIQPEAANTPLRQLYFMAQTMLIDPEAAAEAREMFLGSCARARAAFSDAEVRSGLAGLDELVASGRVFEAMKIIRGLFPLEQAILSASATEAA